MLCKNKMYYICSPLSAPTMEEIRQNMLKARYYMDLISRHFSSRAVAPHAYLPELLDDHIPKERQLGISFGLTLLSWCGGMIVCGTKISSGMQAEIKKAQQMQIPIYLLIEEENDIYLLTYQKEVILKFLEPIGFQNGKR